MSISSVQTIQSNTSAADVLRGRKIPVHRLSSKLVAKAQDKAKKVEEFLTRVKSTSMISLSGLATRYESNCLQELNEWYEPRIKFYDEVDASLHPSYEIKHFQYDLNCYVRYLDAKEKYDRQFLQEMEHFIANQRNICDQFFLKKILCYKTLWPPLHTKRELNNFVSKFFQMTTKQKRRVEYLLKTDLSLGC
ncbi:uncharacterized protein LOC6553211 [Drosophila erecta]|uniref:GG25006 n=1 Tax=Drosophila erecta TaxID=7220 RepID=B3NYQ8_DROER|nr:uncharacterized protein LOC6553211 [Drosophila erecta]EDV48171.1 uncharacterized protein Dere_GG25006 [Drosophila erecta]